MGATYPAAEPALALPSSFAGELADAGHRVTSRGGRVVRRIGSDPVDLGCDLSVGLLPLACQFEGARAIQSGRAV